MRGFQWARLCILFIAMTSQARAELITYDLTYVSSNGGFTSEVGTGKVTIDTSLTTTPGLTFQDGTNFVKAFTLTLNSWALNGTWHFAGFNGSTFPFDPMGPGDHVTGGFGLYDFTSYGETPVPVDFHADLVSQGVQFWIYPNGTEGVTPYSLYPNSISVQSPFEPGLGGVISFHLSSMIPETSTAVPEPSGFLLGVLGIGGALFGYRRRLTRPRVDEPGRGLAGCAMELGSK